MILFDERTHTYSLNGKSLESVSRYIERHKVPFPKEIIAQKTAERDGVTPEDVLKGWELQGKMARELGSAIHTAIEYYVHTGLHPKNATLRAVTEKYESLYDRTKIKREIVVYDDKLAGTIDEIEIVGKKRCIVRDTKTNGDLYKKGKKMLPPYDDLTDSPIDCYTIQLNLYRRLLEHHGWTVEAMEIQHVLDNDIKIIKIEKYEKN